MAYASLGDVRFAQGRDSEAITDLSEALRQNPYNADASQQTFGKLALQRLRPARAGDGSFPYLALFFQPDNALAHYNMGLFMDQQIDKALRELLIA